MSESNESILTNLDDRVRKNPYALLGVGVAVGVGLGLLASSRVIRWGALLSVGYGARALSQSAVGDEVGLAIVETVKKLLAQSSPAPQ